MIIKTKYFGDHEIDETKIITFPQGLLGLEEYKRYAAFDMPENEKLICLQSLEESQIAFIAINPWDYFPDYDINISDDELAVIGIADSKQLGVFNLLSIGDGSYVTANLLAPLVINLNTTEAMQIVLNENKYTTRHELLEQGQEV